MPPTCGDSDVVNKAVVVECDRKALSDGETSVFLHETACQENKKESSEGSH